MKAIFVIGLVFALFLAGCATKEAPQENKEAKLSFDSFASTCADGYNLPGERINGAVSGLTLQVKNTGNVNFDKRAVIDLEIYDSAGQLISDKKDAGFVFWELNPGQSAYIQTDPAIINVKCNKVYKIIAMLREEGYEPVYANLTFKIRISNESELLVSKQLES